MTWPQCILQVFIFLYLLFSTGPFTSWKDISPPSEGACHVPTSPNEQNVGKWRGENTPLSPVRPSGGQADTNAYQNARNNESNGKISKRQGSESRSPRPAKKLNSPVKKNTPLSPSKKLSTSSSSSSAPSSKNSSVSMSPSKLRSSGASSSSSVSTEPNSPKKGKVGHCRSKSGSYQVSAVERGNLDKYRINEIVNLLEEGNAMKPRLTSWKDISPTESKTEGATNNRTRPESGYFSNEVYSESREEIDGEVSLSDSDCHGDTIKLRPPRHQQAKVSKLKPALLAVAGGSSNSIRKDKVEESDTPVDLSRPSGRNENMNFNNGYKEQRLENDDSADGNQAQLSAPGGLVELPSNEDGGAEPNQEPSVTNLVQGYEDGCMNESDSISQSEDQQISQEDTLNDYFFDEDFTVNFEGKLQGSIGVQLQGSCAYSLADSLGNDVGTV